MIGKQVRFLDRTHGGLLTIDESDYWAQHGNCEVQFAPGMEPAGKAPIVAGPAQNGHSPAIESEPDGSDIIDTADQFNSDLDQLKAVIAALNNVAFERRDAINCLFWSLLSKNHFIMYGLPGVGKSYLIRNFANCVEHSYFEYQIDQFTGIDELFGGWDYKYMKDSGLMRRVTAGRMLEKEIAFLDEIGNSSSPIRNALKTLMNERIYIDENGESLQAPLQTLVSASNSELDFTNATEEAFEDRFLARMTIRDLEEDESVVNMLMTTRNMPQLPVISHAAITRLQKKVREVQFTREFFMMAQRLRRKLAEDDLGLVVNARRFNWTMDLVAANCVMHGRLTPKRSDLQVWAASMWKDRDKEQPLLEWLKINLASALSKIEDTEAQMDQELAAYTEAVQSGIPPTQLCQRRLGPK